MKKLLIISPYLATLGGGEEHLFSIAQVLEKQFHFHTDILGENENYLQDLERNLHIKLENASIIKKNDFPWRGMRKYLQMRQYDIVINYFDGSLFFPTAKKNFLFALVPDTKLFANNNPIFQLKLKQYQVISNSQFTSDVIDQYLPKKSQILHPYIQNEIFLDPSQKKPRKIILMIGRFFPHLHSKRQDEAIKAFAKLKEYSNFADFELHLVGRVMPEDSQYFQKLQTLAKNIPSIHFFTNLSFAQVKEKYHQASYFWHFAGWGVNEVTHPQNTEHFGIAPLEAMASSNLTFCYGAGGPKRYIKDGENAYLFNTIEELLEKMITTTTQPNATKQMRKAAFTSAQNDYTYTVFAKKVEQIFLSENTF